MVGSEGSSVECVLVSETLQSYETCSGDNVAEKDCGRQ